MAAAGGKGGPDGGVHPPGRRADLPGRHDSLLRHGAEKAHRGGLHGQLQPPPPQRGAERAVEDGRDKLPGIHQPARREGRLHQQGAGAVGRQGQYPLRAGGAHPPLQAGGDRHPGPGRRIRPQPAQNHRPGHDVRHRGRRRRDPVPRFPGEVRRVAGEKAVPPSVQGKPDPHGLDHQAGRAVRLFAAGGGPDRHEGTRQPDPVLLRPGGRQV